MSTNCLVTKLKTAIDNSGIRKINEFEFDIPGGYDFKFATYTAAALTTVRTDGATFKVNGQGAAVTYAEISGIESRIITDISEPCKLFIQKDSFKAIKNSTRMKCDWYQFIGSNLVEIYINNEGGEPIDFNTLPEGLEIVTVTVYGPTNVNIDNLSRMTDLAVLQINDLNNIDLLQLATRYIIKGRDEGTIIQSNVNISNCNFEGNTVERGKYTLAWINNRNNTHTVTLTQVGSSEPLYSKVVNY